jgi:hypothetical protein
MTTSTDIPWKHITESSRKRLIWWVWLFTWLLLLGGLFHQSFYPWVVVLSALHALLFLWLFGFRKDPFPVQVRLAYFLWTFVGTYVPGMTILMYITTVGLPANLFMNYCPLARLMLLMPWNRSEPFSLNLLKRAFLSPPSVGRFVPRERG